MIIGAKKISFREVSSTNSVLADMALKEKLPEGTVITADFQTFGRGQKDNRWESRRGENLTFSILLYPDFIEPAEQFILSMAISLGVADYLSEFTNDYRIKWPNDIYVGNDKISGILIENSIEGSNIRYSIAGIGLNLNQTEFSGAANPVSLKMITGMEHVPDQEIDRLLRALDKRYKQLIAGESTNLGIDYTRQLFRLNEWQEYTGCQGRFTGCIRSVSHDGRLQVQRKDGTIEAFSFKEIEFIL